MIGRWGALEHWMFLWKIRFRLAAWGAFFALMAGAMAWYFPAGYEGMALLEANSPELATRLKIETEMGLAPAGASLDTRSQVMKVVTVAASPDVAVVIVDRHVAWLIARGDESKAHLAVVRQQYQEAVQKAPGSPYWQTQADILRHQLAMNQGPAVALRQPTRVAPNYRAWWKVILGPGIVGVLIGWWWSLGWLWWGLEQGRRKDFHAAWPNTEPEAKPLEMSREDPTP